MIDMTSLAAIAGTAATILLGLNALLLGWLHNRMATLDQRISMIFDVLDEKYVRKDLYQAEVEDINRRLASLERHIV